MEAYTCLAGAEWGWGRGRGNYQYSRRSPEGHIRGRVSFLKWQRCRRTGLRGGKKGEFGEALMERFCTGEGAFPGEAGCKVKGRSLQNGKLLTVPKGECPKSWLSK